MTEVFAFYDLDLANAKFEDLRIEGGYESLVSRCDPILISEATGEIRIALYTITVTRIK